MACRGAELAEEPVRHFYAVHVEWRGGSGFDVLRAVPERSRRDQQHHAVFFIQRGRQRLRT